MSKPIVIISNIYARLLMTELDIYKGLDQFRQNQPAVLQALSEDQQEQLHDHLTQLGVIEPISEEEYRALEAGDEHLAVYLDSRSVITPTADRMAKIISILKGKMVKQFDFNIQALLERMAVGDLLLSTYAKMPELLTETQYFTVLEDIVATDEAKTVEVVETVLIKCMHDHYLAYNIGKFGWMMQGVMSDEGELPYVYTVGLPHVVLVVGADPNSISSLLGYYINTQVIPNGVEQAVFTEGPLALADGTAQVLTVSLKKLPRPGVVAEAYHFINYKPEQEVYQLIYPDENNRLPGEEGFDTTFDQSLKLPPLQ